MRRVVITGMGCVTPIGNDVKSSWDAILNNKCGIDEIKNFDTTDFKVKLAGEVKNLNLEDYFDLKEIKNNDKFTLFARIASRQAIKDSEIDLEKIDHSRFGVCFASGIGGIETIYDNSVTLIERGPSRISPHFIPKSLINLSAGSISIEFKAQGYVNSVVTACAAGTNAIGDAFNRIRMGYEDIMIAGGSEAAVCKIGIAGFQAMRALHTGTDKNRASIPFDAERSGFVMGEGAGALIIEDLDHALARGAKIYAELIGYGVSCDANHITAPLSDGSIAANALNMAIKDANIKPSDIDYINAHGTSTHLNDLTETNTIKLVFGDDAKNVLISSTKSNTGHLLGAAGAIEAIFCVKALNDGVVPATINYKTQDPECDLNIVPNKNIKKDLNIVMSNSLGFGGHNASIILKKWSA